MAVTAGLEECSAHLSKHKHFCATTSLRGESGCRFGEQACASSPSYLILAYAKIRNAIQAYESHSGLADGLLRSWAKLEKGWKTWQKTIIRPDKSVTLDLCGMFSRYLVVLPWRTFGCKVLF